jgi:hypothetical protein
MFRPQADLLVQFAEHSLFGRFPPIDAPLRELPGVFAYSLAPEDLVALIDQNNADVRAKTFPIEHDATFEYLTADHSSTDVCAWKVSDQR